MVERTFAWILRNRRMSRDYEFLPETGEAFDLRDDDPADAQKVGERSRMRASQTPSRPRPS